MRPQKIKKRGIRDWMYLLPLLLTMASCIKEPALDAFPDVPEGMVRVGLYTSSGDYQIPATRVGQADENTVDQDPWVFVFKNLDSDKKFVEAVQAEPSDGESYVTLTKTTEKRMLLILANPPAEFFNGTDEVDLDQDNVETWLTGKTYDEAQKMLTTALTTPNQTTVPYVSSTIPMSETLALNGINAGTVIEKTLLRIVAKVTVHNSASGFELYGAAVAGASRQGYLFPVGAVTADDGGETPLKTNYLTTTEGQEVTGIAPVNAAKTVDPIYIYESAAGETSVIVKGMYNTTEGYYRLAFKSKENGNVMAVGRNKWYKFEITSVNGAGFGTVAEAIAAQPSNNITATVEVVDLSSHDMIDNGTYYLGVSNSEFIAYSDDELTGVVAVTVTTNATAAMIETTGTNTVAVSSGLSVSRGTLILGFDGVTPSETVLTFSDFPASVNGGTITLKLGNLQKEIRVTRRAPLDAATIVTEFADEYAAGEIVPQGGESDWLSLSTDGETSKQEVARPDGAGSLYLMTTYNFYEDRVQEVYLYRHNESGRVKLHVKQKVYHGLGYALASPGVIGYIHNPGKPNHHQLTLDGSREYAGTQVDTEEPSKLSRYTVFVAQFKWGSLIAIGTEGGQNDPFDEDDVIAAPKEYRGLNNYDAALALVKEEVRGGGSNQEEAWKRVPYYPTADGWPIVPDEGRGDPCKHYADFFGDGWRLPTTTIRPYSWHPESSPFGVHVPREEVSWRDMTNGAAWVTADDPCHGAVAGDGSGGQDWTMFLPAAGYRVNTGVWLYTTRYYRHVRYWASTTADTGYNMGFVLTGVLRPDNSSKPGGVKTGDELNSDWACAVRCVEATP